MTSRPKRFLQCPCGEFLEADDEDGIVRVAQLHLASRHPERHYTREQILMIAS